MNTSNDDGLEARRNRRDAPWVAWPRDERGSVTVMVALTMTALVAILALGIDLGGLFDARSEAQRAADAAALAGASAFLEYQQDEARAAAVERAVDFATSNAIRSRPIAPEEVEVSVNLDSSTVRAAVRRDGVATWFARLVGIDEVDIGAEATAWAGEAGAAQCVKPFAVPDMWHDVDDDLNNNHLWDEGERWKYEPENGDQYAGFSGPGGSLNETGYGSDWRDGEVDARGRMYEGDYGRQITIKVTNPRNAYVPSFFLPWVLPEGDEAPSCGSGPGGGGPGNGGGPGTGGGTGNGGGENGPGGGEGGGEVEGPGNSGGGGGWLRWREKREDLGAPDNPPENPNAGSNPNGGGGTGSPRGAAWYRQNICGCNTSVIDLDTEYLIEPGNMVGPTYQGVQRLIEQDPGAYWDESRNTVISDYGMSSPRVVTVALFDPGEITNPGRQNIRFNNFARIFIEEQDSRRDDVTGRFLYYVPGVGQGGPGQTTGSLVRVLQLIE